MNRLIRVSLIGCRSKDMIDAAYWASKRSFSSLTINIIQRKLDAIQLFEVHRRSNIVKDPPWGFEIRYQTFNSLPTIVRFTSGWKLNELPIDPKGFKALQALALQNGVPFSEIE